MLSRLVGRVVLVAFPKPFRDRLGRPLVQTLLTDCRTPSGRMRVGRFAAGAVDVVGAGLAERIAARQRRDGRRDRRSLLDALWQDLRYGARRLNHSRGFTVIALLTLALGIGANTALFQLLDAVRLRPVPVPSPGQLAEIRVGNGGNERGDFSIWHGGATNAMWEEIRRRQDAFTGVFAWSDTGMSLTADTAAEPRFLPALLVSGEFFPTLGVQPALGRLFTPADDARGCTAPGVVLSQAFWQREFAGDTGVLGRTITLGQDAYHVVGVTPREFTGLNVGHRFDIAVPLCAEWLPAGSPNRLESGTAWFLIVMGRLKPGWTLARASAHLAAVSPAVFDGSLPANYPAESVKSYREFRLTAIDASGGISLLREQYTAALWFLQATAVLVLLVGCANLANLMLARASTREREIAARVALGASRWQIIRVLLAESMLLSVVGALAGAWLARGLSVELVRFLDGGSDTVFLDLALDWRLLVFTSGAAMLTSLLSGLAPAWRAANISPEIVLRGSGRGLTDGRSRVGLRQALVVAQVGLSLVLLAGALLFTRSLGKLMLQDLGLRPDGLTIAYVDLSGTKVPVERRAAFKRDMLRGLTATPGVVAVAETSVVPLSGSASDNDVWLDGPENTRATSFFMDTGAGYFDVVGMPLVAGRTFDDDRDTPDSPRVAVVNEAFTRTFLAGGNPVGRYVWRQANPTQPQTRYEIVGLVKDAKYQSLRQAFSPTIYLPTSQDQRPGTFAQLLIRTSLPAATVVPALRSRFKEAGPGVVPTFQNFRELIDLSLVQDQLLAGLSAFFGVLAVLLATLGLYGSMSFAVARRTKEIGLRMALGADRRGVLAMVLREASVLVAVGCALGGALALLLARFVGTLVYHLEPHDPTSMLAAALLLAAVALGASVVPARRAARLDPMAAFRAE